MPLQLFVIGNIAIAGVPFEITTMAGRRLRKRIEQSLKPLKIHHVVLATLANSYAGYITTREEYRIQRYEGASNQFDGWTLNAYSRSLIN